MGPRAKGPSQPITDAWRDMMREAMAVRGLSARELARRIRRPHTVVTRLLEGQESSRAALAIAQELDIPPPNSAVSSVAEQAAVDDLHALRDADPAAFADVVVEIRKRLDRIKNR